MKENIMSMMENENKITWTNEVMILKLCIQL